MLGGLSAEPTAYHNAVVRGDVAPITIGDRSNVQDGSCIHVTHDTGPTHIGNDERTPVKFDNFQR